MKKNILLLGLTFVLVASASVTGVALYDLKHTIEHHKLCKLTKQLDETLKHVEKSLKNETEK